MAWNENATGSPAGGEIVQPVAVVGPVAMIVAKTVAVAPT
jgi:hypothetical protein